MNYNKTEIAQKTGLSRQAISRILNGKQKNPKLQTLEKIAEAMKIDFEELRLEIKKKEIENSKGEDYDRDSKNS